MRALQASRPSPVATRPSGHKKGFYRPCMGPGAEPLVWRSGGLGWDGPPEVDSYLTRLRLSNEKANLLLFGNSVVNKP